ncbi:MAG: GvpL/GvpF family gas vesicle protein [Mangrovibacterium sp.]
METKYLYLYGITHNDYPPEQFLELKGMGLEVVQYEKIFAIAAEKPYENLMHASKEILAGILVGHQKILERLMETGFSMLIPVKLGTWSKSKTEVREILKKGYPLCLDILEKVCNRIEVDLAVTWSNFSGLIQTVAADPEVSVFKDGLLGKANGISTADQLQIGKLVREKLDEKARDARQQIVKQLEPWCEELKRHEVMNDQMVANVAFLISKSKLASFEEALDQMDMEFKGALNFKYVGPLPCYSFYTLEVVELNFEQIEQARNALGVQERASAREIRQAYLAKVKSFHPDVNFGNGEEAYFESLTKAYHVINDYLQTVRQSSDEDLFYFTEEQVTENSFLVKIRE